MKSLATFLVSGLLVPGLITGAMALTAVPAAAQSRKTPYWASVKVEKIHMRVGPGKSYPIDWVYRRPDLPLKIIRIKEGWRLVEDPDGTKGWMVARFLSRKRTAIIQSDTPAPLRGEAASGAEVLWRAEPGVVGTLGKCVPGWCRFEVSERAGWVEKASLWGAGEP